MHSLDEVYSKTQIAELWVTYLLFALFFSAPIGALFCLGKLLQFKYFQDSSSERDQRSIAQLKRHYQWLINTFVGAVVMSMAALGTMYYMFGFLIALFLVCWWVYRLARGLLALIESADLPLAV